MFRKTSQVVYRLIGLVLILSFFACDNGSGSSSSREIPEEDNTGSLSFTIEWGDEAPDSDTTSRAAVDCVGRGLATIDVVLYNSADEVIASRSWPCDAHGGTLDDIPAPQSELTLLLMGKNTAGNVTYRGSQGELSIEAGRASEAGAVDVFYFVPPSVTPAGTANSFQWNEVHGAAKYRVTISASEDFSAVAETGDVDTPSYTATQLDPGQEYFVKVYAIGAYDNESEASEIATFTTLALSAVPQNVSAGDDLMKVNVAWEGESDKRYNLYWSTNPGVTKETHEGKIEDIEALSYTHENLQGNTVYYYVVTSENSVGQESAVSAEASATAVGNPTGPENVSATAGERQVALSWTAAPGFVYNIYWTMEPGVSKTEYQEKIAGITGDGYLHEDCSSTRHYYIITAENELGESEPLGEVSASPGWLELLTDELNGLSEESKDVAVDAEGNTFVLGWYERQFEDRETAGGRDLIIAKFDSQGGRIWAKTVGSDEDDYASSIGLDAAGNIYVSGTTFGDWGDQFPNPTGEYQNNYNFVLKIDPEGELLRIMAYRPDSYDLKRYNHITVDANGIVYLTGTFERSIDPEWPARTADDFFTVKYNTDGGQEWAHIFNESEYDASHGITLDGQGGVYVAGRSQGEILIIKFTEAGEEVWRTLHGNADGNIGYSIAVEGDACYVSGRWDPYKLHISRFNTADGTHLWTEVVDGVWNEGTNALSIAPNGNLLWYGDTKLPVFDGQENAGGEYPFDGLLIAYDGEGTRLWSRLHGIQGRDYCGAVVVDDDAYAHIVGFTEGDLAGKSNSGGFDIFTWKLYVGP